MDDLYSEVDQGYMLLAYYFGRRKVLNSIALLRITDELLHAFEQIPENKTTKYSVHIDGCCLCQEKEDIFKILMKRYYQSTDAWRWDPEDNDVGAQDLDEAWRELTALWKDAGLLVEGEDGTTEASIIHFAQAAQSLLFKHGVKLHGEERYNKEVRNRNWKALVKIVKDKLDECLFTIERINGKEYLSVPGSAQTNRNLRNIYLGLLVKKGARARAKFLQTCRTVGIQIRAAKDPIAVVAKYMLCVRCLDPQSRMRLILITDILKRCREELEACPLLDEPPDVGERLGNSLEQRRALADQNVDRNNFSYPCATQEPKILPDSLRRSNRRVNAVKKRHEEFVYYANGLGPHSEKDSTPRKSRPAKRRRASLPDVSPCLSEPIAIDIKQERISPKNENFSVVVFTSETKSTTLASSPVHTATPLPTTPNLTALQSIVYGCKQMQQVGQPISNTQPFGVRLSVPGDSLSPNVSEKTRVIPISPGSFTKILNDSKSRKVIFVPSPPGNKAFDFKKTTVVPFKMPPVPTNVVRGRSFSLDSVPRQKVVFQSIKPKLSGAAGSSATSAPRFAPKKPFLVKIVDGKICRAAATPGIIANVTKKRPQNTFRAISLNGRKLKFVHPKPAKKPTGIITTLQGAGKMIDIEKMKPPTGVPKALVMRNSEIRSIMRIGPMTINTPQTRGHAEYGQSFTFKTVASTSNMANDHLKLQSPTCIRPRTITANLNTPTKSCPQVVAVHNSTPFKKIASVQMNSPNKTPAKKRNLKLPSKSMATVVAEYIFSLMPSADEALWKKVQDRNKRRGEKSSSQIPIPYETNFLCVAGTIERQGWKAYWYRKCRCSKIRERAAEADAEVEGDSQQNPMEIAAWIPKSVTNNMRDTLTLSMEMEDKALSKEKWTPVKVLLEGCGSGFQLELKNDEKMAPEIASQDLLKNNSFLQGSPGVVALLEKTDNSSQNCGAVGKKRKWDEVAATAEKKHTPSLTLKAKYRKDKDGNWTAMKTHDSEDAPRREQNRDTNAPIRSPLGTSSHSEDSVMLNIRPGLDAPRNSSISMEDRVGTTQDHGLRRCARATMIRRKALVQRAFHAEMRSKVKRERAESIATRSFLFNSFRDESFAWPVFDVVSAHPLCFREEPDQYIRISETQENKRKILRAVCKDDGAKTPKEKRGTRSADNSFLSFLSNTPTSLTAQVKKSINKKSMPQQVKRESLKRFPARKRNVGEKVVSEPPRSQTGTQKLTSFTEGYAIWKRKVVNQINPKGAPCNLQVLRGVSASAPPTNVISEQAARFVVGAVQIPDVKLAVKSKRGRPRTKCAVGEPSSASTAMRDTTPRIVPAGLSDYLPLWLRNDSPETQNVRQTVGQILNNDNYTRASTSQDELPKNCLVPSVEGDKLEDDADVDVVTLSPQRESAAARFVNGGPCPVLNFRLFLTGLDPVYQNEVGGTRNGICTSVPSFSTIYRDVKLLAKTGQLSWHSLSPDMDCDPANAFSRFLYLKRMRSHRKLTRLLSSKYDPTTIATSMKRSLAPRRENTKGDGGLRLKQKYDFEKSVEANGASSDPWWLRQKFDGSPDACIRSEDSSLDDDDFLEVSSRYSSPEVTRGLKFSRCSKPDVELNAETEFVSRSSPPQSDSATPTGEQSDTRPLIVPGSTARNAASDSVSVSPRRNRVPRNALDGMYWSDVVDADGREPKKVGIYLRRRHVNGDKATEAGRIQVNKRKRPGCGYLQSSSGESTAILEADKMSLKKYNGDVVLDVESEDTAMPLPLCSEPFHALLSTSLNVERVRSWMWNSSAPRPLELTTTASKTRPLADREEDGRSIRRHSTADVKTERPTSDFREGGGSKGDVKTENRREKRYFSDGDQRQTEPSFPAEKSSSFSPMLDNAYIPLVRCPTPPRMQSSPLVSQASVSKTVPSEGEEPASPWLPSSLLLIKFVDRNGQRCDKRPRGLSKTRGGELGRLFDIPGVPKTATRFKFGDCFGKAGTTGMPGDEIAFDDARSRLCVSPAQDVLDFRDAEGENSPATPKRGLRPRCAKERMANDGDRSLKIQPGRGRKHVGRGRCRSSLFVGRKKTKLQALRETVFAELKRKRRGFRGKKPSSVRMSGRQNPATDKRRPLLQSTCSTRGSYIKRLLESDEAGLLA